MNDDVARLLHSAAQRVPDLLDRPALVQRRRRALIAQRATVVVTASLGVVAGAFALVQLGGVRSEETLMPTVAAASPASSPTSSQPSPTVSTVADACPAVLAPIHLPENAVLPERAYVCTKVQRSAPEGGVRVVTVAHEVTAGLPQVLAAFAVPDEPPGFPCILRHVGPMVVWFHSAEGTVAVRAAEDQCGQPTEAAQAAFLGLTLEPLAEQTNE